MIQVAALGMSRRGQDGEPAPVAGQQRLEDREVEVLLGGRSLGDGVLRDQLHGDRDVAEGQVEVDHADAQPKAARATPG